MSSLLGGCGCLYGLRPDRLWSRPHSFFFGAVVALYGVKRFGAQGFWITLVRMGSVPMALVTVQYYTADPRTIIYPIHPLPILALAFGPIVLGGLIWSRIEHQRTRATH